jgi:hypothetical protein
MVDRERMGVPIDPLAPITDDPEGPYGYAFDDPANVDFWWERGAQPAWQTVQITSDAITEHDLWDTPTYSPFVALRDLAADDPEVAKGIVQPLAPVLSFGLLGEANTVTYRDDDVMLSTVQDFRPGTYADQVQSWQATLDEEAIVFATNPKNEPFEGEDSWPDADGYWTGTGTLPRSAQHGRASVSLYAPLTGVTAPIGDFNRLDITHAWFPTERFDEVVRDGHWTFGRNDDGYVALWSWRTPEWREHDPHDVFTDGMTEPFDLVAPGGADNVWITEVGSASISGTFEEFMEAQRTSGVGVTVRPVRDDGLPGGFDVTYGSPSAGTLALGQDGPFTVDGEEVDLQIAARYDNPWAQVDFRGGRYDIADADGGLVLDFDAGTRQTS